MENCVLEFDIGLGEGEDVNVNIINIENEDEEMNDSLESGSGDTAFGHQIYVPEGDIDLEPFEGMEFESEEAAKAFYNSYARRVGFSTRVSSSHRSKKDGAIRQRTFVCSKEGFRNLNDKRTKDRELKRPRTVTRVGCKASLSVKIHDSGKWLVSCFLKEHNHELVPPDQVHCLRSHRQISGPAKTLIDTLQASGMAPSKIMSVLIKEYGGASKVGFTEVDCKNYMSNNRQRDLDGGIQLLLDYLKQKKAENPDFFYAVQGDEDQYARNIFWADSKSIADYRHFGDTVTFDTTYRSNKYRLPFAPFTGLNHHGQPVLFGCTFLMNESEALFVWLFKTWLEAMSVRPPVSITTEDDTVIRSAIMQVLPNTRHRFCKWHMFRKCQEKLSHVLLKHPHFEADFHKCVNLSDTIDEFESCWHSLVDRYELRDNEWILAIFADRRQWVPVYLRDTFFAEMSMTQRSDTINSYFDGYVNASTNLNQFFKLYEKALESRHEKEVKADFDTINASPVIKTPSPMEKQASRFYTRKLFIRFQEELVNTLAFMVSKMEDDGEVTNYQVSKFGEEHKACHVRFNVLEMRATCSCQMFEFSGLLCRHVLAVFRVSNVLTLPSHFILKRWKRNAKSSVILDEPVIDTFNNYLESHMVRYNTLRHEAFKFVDEGAESIESYSIAVAALAEASKKVSLAAKNEGKTLMTNGSKSKVSARDGILRKHSASECQGSSAQQLSEEDMDQKINELSTELKHANQKCEMNHINLQEILKDIENHKQRLLAEVQDIKLSLRDCS